MTAGLLDRTAAAKRLGISSRTLARYDRDGTGPGFVRIGERMVRYAPEACDAWIAAHSFPHRAAELTRPQPRNETAGS